MRAGVAPPAMGPERHCAGRELFAFLGQLLQALALRFRKRGNGDNRPDESDEADDGACVSEPIRGIKLVRA